MVRLDRITTKTGDKGTTRLVGGREVLKDDPRVETYGTVDELNTILGLARTFLQPHRAAQPAVADRLQAILCGLQRQLFTLGAEMATATQDRRPEWPHVRESDVAALETLQEELNAELPPLESFLLPGGGDAVPAFLHQARTVCRRAERRAVSLYRDGQLSDAAYRYLNRLSDLLFVTARFAAKHFGDAETLWQQKAAPVAT